MTLCGDATLVKQDAGRRIAATLKCRSWGCDECQPQRRNRLIAEAIRGQPTKFLTLTSRPKEGQDAPDAARELSHAWRLLRLRLMRRYRLKALAFLAVSEATEKGQPHLHILIRGPWLDQRFISEVMAELTNSPIVHIAVIDSPGRIAGYCAKYVGKAPMRFGTCKRYWSSRDFQLTKFERPPSPEDEWKILGVERVNIKGLAWQWHELGCLLTWDRKGRCFATAPPDWPGRW